MFFFADVFFFLGGRGKETMFFLLFFLRKMKTSGLGEHFLRIDLRLVNRESKPAFLFRKQCSFVNEDVNLIGSMQSVSTFMLSIWSNYSDLTRPHPKWWFSKGNPIISGKSRLVKYYNLARSMLLLYFLF